MEKTRIFCWGQCFVFMYSKIRVCARPLVCLPARPPARLAGRPHARLSSARLSACENRVGASLSAPVRSHACPLHQQKQHVKNRVGKSLAVSPAQGSAHRGVPSPSSASRGSPKDVSAVGRVHRVDRPTDCPFCPLPPAPSVYLSASPIVRLPFLSASPCAVRLPVRLCFCGGEGGGGAFFLCGCFCFFVGFLCEGGRVNVSHSGCTEDATQRARTCGGSCMSLEKPRWWSPFGGCQRTMLRQQCLFESIVMLCVRCTPWPVRRCAVLRMSAPRTRPACQLARPPARPPARLPACPPVRASAPCTRPPVRPSACPPARLPRPPLRPACSPVRLAMGFLFSVFVFSCFCCFLFLLNRADLFTPCALACWGFMSVSGKTRQRRPFGFSAIDFLKKNRASARPLPCAGRDLAPVSAVPPGIS